MQLISDEGYLYRKVWSLFLEEILSRKNPQSLRMVQLVFEAFRTRQPLYSTSHSTHTWYSCVCTQDVAVAQHVTPDVGLGQERHLQAPAGFLGPVPGSIPALHTPGLRALADRTPPCTVSPASVYNLLAPPKAPKLSVLYILFPILDLFSAQDPSQGARSKEGGQLLWVRLAGNCSIA